MKTNNSNTSDAKTKLPKSKYNVSHNIEKRTYNGIVFDSVLEIKYLREMIEPAVESGTIIRWERQKIYTLQEGFKRNGKTVLPIDYKADFYIVYADGREQAIDIKGCPSEAAKLKRKMFWFKYPNVDYVWLGYSKLDGGWVDYESIQAGRRQRKRAKKEMAKENKE